MKGYPSLIPRLSIAVLVVAVLFLSLASQSAAQSAGLVAAYAFNEGGGTTVSDASGNGITGTIVDAAWTPGGKYGNALGFNGTGSYVDLGNPPQLQITGSMTWSAWVWAATNPPDDGQIVAKSADKSGWQFKSSPDTGPETFGVAISPDGNYHVQRYSTTVRALNTWYFVAGVYNASAQTLDIYVNGVLDNGVLDGTVPSSQFDPAHNVTIGRRAGGYYFNGVIDEVRIYNRALSESEIVTDMNTPIENPPLPIQLASFTGTRVGNDVRLDWTTLSELNNYGFFIQRKRGTDPLFADIPNSFIPGHGTTNEPQRYSFFDSPISSGTWNYRLKQMDLDGTIHYSEPISIDVLTGVTDRQIPLEFSLLQNYPDPFNPSTTIRYALPFATHVSLSVYNTLGQKIAQLVDAEQSAGYHEAVLRGDQLPSGMYFYRIEAGSFTGVRRMMLLK